MAEKRSANVRWTGDLMKGSGVVTGYTTDGPETFCSSLDCFGTGAFVDNCEATEIACDGLQVGGEDVSLAQEGAALTVSAVGGDATYTLPPGVALDSCCSANCCAGVK